MRIVFMGTPDFALYTLSALCEKHDVAAVVTQPDRPGNRGAVVQSPVKRYAAERGIPVLQYEKLRKEGADDLRALGADIFVTAAYGQILSCEILDIPPHGVVNVHASLLPKYRGSSPIQWALINGEKETGVTVMQTAEGLDTGDILLAKKIEILPEDTAGTLFDKLGGLGAETLLEYLNKLECGETVVPVPQNEAEATYFPILKKSDGLIDWTASAEAVCNRVRGVTPWPGAFTYHCGRTIKLHRVLPADGTGRPGEVIVSDRSGIIVACGRGSVRLEELQAEGKKRMSYADFLNGNKITEGEILG